MIVDIDGLYEMLSWNSDEDIQEEGRKIASKLKHLSVLILPIEDKSVWENCAKVLAEKSDKELSVYSYPLLEWLQDLTWPGALIILERLKRVKDENFYLTYINVIEKVIKTADEPWQSGLSELLENPYIRDQIPRTTADRLMNL